jgi:hypothetical protein
MNPSSSLEDSKTGTLRNSYISSHSHRCSGGASISEDMGTILKLDDKKYIFHPIAKLNPEHTSMLVVETTPHTTGIRMAMQSTIYFNKADYNVHELAEEEVVERFTYFGIAGVVDLEFAAYFLIIEDRKVVSHASSERKIYKPTKIRYVGVTKTAGIEAKTEPVNGRGSPRRLDTYIYMQRASFIRRILLV